MPVDPSVAGRALRVSEGQCWLCIGRALAAVDDHWQFCANCGRRFHVEAGVNGVSVVERIPCKDPDGYFDWRGKTVTGGGGQDTIITATGERLLITALHENGSATYRVPEDAEWFEVAWGALQ